MNAKGYFQPKNPTFAFKNEETNYYKLFSSSMFYGTVKFYEFVKSISTAFLIFTSF